jgi:hypothetical protein
MQIQRLSLLLAAIAMAGIAWPSGPARLVIDVPPAVAPIQPFAEGHRIVRLPALDFEFGIQASCGPGKAVKSVSISVADTHMSLDDADLREGTGGNAVFRLPARQIAPVVVDGFCPATAAAGDSLLIRGAITAHLSLRCASEVGDSITYASQLLDVTLVCEAGPEAQGDAPASTDR